jgi:hypothetical protein
MTMSEPTKKLTRVCRCENCGNEAEMVVTCSLEDVDTPHQHDTSSGKPEKKSAEKKIKGSATCKNCGNEADMWIDLE